MAKYRRRNTTKFVLKVYKNDKLVGTIRSASVDYVVRKVREQ